LDELYDFFDTCTGWCKRGVEGRWPIHYEGWPAKPYTIFFLLSITEILIDSEFATTGKIFI
jgi:hypothetical protein